VAAGAELDGEVIVKRLIYLHSRNVMLCDLEKKPSHALIAQDNVEDHISVSNKA
jgi:hypothetical protein